MTQHTHESTQAPTVHDLVGKVRWELSHDTLNEVYVVKRIEVVAVVPTRDAAKQWMLATAPVRESAPSFTDTLREAAQ